MERTRGSKKKGPGLRRPASPKAKEKKDEGLASSAADPTGRAGPSISPHPRPGLPRTPAAGDGPRHPRPPPRRSQEPAGVAVPEALGPVCGSLEPGKHSPAPGPGLGLGTAAAPARARTASAGPGRGAAGRRRRAREPPAGEMGGLGEEGRAGPPRGACSEPHKRDGGRRSPGPRRGRQGPPAPPTAGPAPTPSAGPRPGSASHHRATAQPSLARPSPESGPVEHRSHFKSRQARAHAPTSASSSAPRRLLLLLPARGGTGGACAGTFGGRAGARALPEPPPPRPAPPRRARSRAPRARTRPAPWLPGLRSTMSWRFSGPGGPGRSDGVTWSGRGGPPSCGCPFSTRGLVCLEERTCQILVGGFRWRHH